MRVPSAPPTPRIERHLLAVLVAAVVACGHLVATQPQAALCEPGLRQQPGEWGYRLRGDRCEGLYEELSAEGTIRPVSLTMQETVPAFADRHEIWWVNPAVRSEILLRATSLRRSLFYRMDTITKSATYFWSTDVARGVKIEPPQLGFMAATQERVRERQQRVYLPVGLTSRPAAKPGQYRLRAVAPSELLDMSIAVSAVTSANSASVIPRRWLGFPYYPSSPPMSFSIDLSGKPFGVYEVSLTGKLASDGGTNPTSTTFLMRHGS